jgi:hypothetical protein
MTTESPFAAPAESAPARFMAELLADLLCGGAPPAAGSERMEELHRVMRALIDDDDDESVRQLGIHCAAIVCEYVRSGLKAERAALLAQLFGNAGGAPRAQ